MKRSLALLAIPLVALGLVACGDDDDDDPGSTTGTEVTDDTEATDDTGATDDTSGDITLPDVSLPDVSLPGGTLPGGITVPDLSLPDISIPDVSVPDMTEILSQVFPNLDDEQVSCLADALGDVAEVDPSQVMDLLDDCNIDPSDILPGG